MDRDSTKTFSSLLAVTPGARLAAAIEVLSESDRRHRPLPDALRDWAREHRFAGSSDRTAILNLANACLRRKASLAWRMGEPSSRALVLGAARFVWGWSMDELRAALEAPHAPATLTDTETEALAGDTVESDIPDAARADVPDWLFDHLKGDFGSAAVSEGEGLAGRAPVDIRTNALKVSRDKLLKTLGRFDPAPTELSPWGIRFAVAEGPGRLPAIEQDPAHGRGHFEVQDEGSQIAAMLVGARSGMQVLDFCAGAGGKTLAMSAAMEGRGQIHAHDADAHRLRPIVERLKRAGAHNVQIARDVSALEPLIGRADRVLVDAPCSGSGTWRRRPDSKWRLTEEALKRRIEEQKVILKAAAPYVRPGGRLIYVTCSVIGSENAGQIADFCTSHPDFSPVPHETCWREANSDTPPDSAIPDSPWTTLTPNRHRTDGFFIAVLERAV